MAIRESAWQGRAEGFDKHTSSNTFKNNEIDLLKESIKLKKKNIQRGELPPLISDITNNIGSNNINTTIINDNSTIIQNNRVRSAPDSTMVGTLHNSFPDEPEGIFMNNNNNNIHQSLSTITNKNNKKVIKKQKKISETEQRLMNSPLAQPLVKH